jgi:anti-sigma factor RsiW
MAHPDREELVGYALGALDPASGARVADHVPRCERCHRELLRLDPALGVLAESVEQLEPPESLRRSLMATVRSEAEQAADPIPSPARERRPWLRIGGFSLGPATALAAVLIVVAVLVGYGVRDAGEEDAETISAQAPAGVTATLELTDDHGTLEASSMPALPKGAVYQVWVGRDGRVEPSSAFVPSAGGYAEAAVPELEGADQVMVTQESEPGHTRPTSKPMITVNLG